MHFSKITYHKVYSGKVWKNRPSDDASASFDIYWHWLLERHFQYSQADSCVKKVPKIDRYFLLTFDKKSIARCHQLQYNFIFKNYCHTPFNVRKIRYLFLTKDQKVHSVVLSPVHLRSLRELMCESITTGEHPPRANPGHLFHDESRGTDIWQLIVSRSPGHLKTTTNLFCNILSLFPTALRFKGFKQSFWSRWRAFIDHKRPIKAKEPFALSFFSQSDSFRDLFYAVLLSWNGYVY